MGSVWIYWTSFRGEGELSLTQLSPVCCCGNPLLSGTQAAPVQHGFTQNARVRFCSGARQRGRQQTRNPVTHTHTHTHEQTHSRPVTSVCRLSGVQPVSNLITARPVTGVGTQTGTGNLLFNPSWHRSEAHAAVRRGNV